MIDTLAIVGIGLIGSSLARAAREKGLARCIVAMDTTSICQEVMDLGLVDAASPDPAKIIHGANVIILAVPVGAMGEVARTIAPFLKHGAIVSDVGSVKAAVITAVSPHIPLHAAFVPAHPVAGTEKSGPTAGFAELFEGRWVILTPTTQESLSLKTISTLWEGCGAHVVTMDAAHHDLVLGMTSHLPQLIAYTIVQTATELSEDMREEVIRYSAGGFRDFTRIAASDPTMWRDIFLHNRDATLEILQRFTEDLTALQKAIRHKDGDYLFDVFTKTRDIRRHIIEAGQAAPEETKKKTF